MRKMITLLLAACIGGSGLLTAGCATRSPLQKKTASYKRKAKPGKIPCPCDKN